jgi:ADP-ribose pyrophosphatase YjhB (NUDIX family)
VPDLIDQGDWGHSLFEVYLDLDGRFDKYRVSTTGVFCVCFGENDQVILANYEPLGGHLEVGESVEDALKREALEEGGMKLLKWKYYGFYKVTMKNSAPRKYKSKYPAQSYLLFFLALGERIALPYGQDVKSSQKLSRSEILASTSITHKMLKEGVKLFPNYLDTKFP